MSKNIVIYSDGTGQAGGLKPDQSISNVYKLYRASRPGTDSVIDPRDQVAFYDAGIGTDNDAGSIPLRSLQRFRKFWSATTGTGLSRNIADCYEAIIKHYEPGDRVFLVGFSRGAYTARCVGGVMGLCGIPTHGVGGTPLPRFGKALRAIADEAVEQVYEHGSGRDDPEKQKERQEKGRRFRAKYGSGTDEQSNQVPYFIGVFDTVAALGASGIRWVAMATSLALVVLLFALVIAGILSLMPWFDFAGSFSLVVLAISAMVAISLWQTSFKVIHDYPSAGESRWHFAAWRHKFYDNTLNKRVRFARHALAIDESRMDFDRVPWASPDDIIPTKAGEPEWLKQIWFAGNHSDIGGGYPEDESRLSDISLGWMQEEAQALPHPLIVDQTKLRLFPDATAMQHSEIEHMRDQYPWWIPKFLQQVWKEQVRPIRKNAALHPTVITRSESPAVSHYGIAKPYRPNNLVDHDQLKRFYSVADYRLSGICASMPAETSF